MKNPISLSRANSVLLIPALLALTTVLGATLLGGCATTKVSAVSGSTGAPAILTQPANQTVVAGQNAGFGVSVSGTPPFTFQWYMNGAAVAGANYNTFILKGATAAQNGATLYVVVGDADGSITSAKATLTVTGIGVNNLASLSCGSAAPSYGAAISVTPTFAAGTGVIGSTGANSSDIAAAAVSGDKLHHRRCDRSADVHAYRDGPERREFHDRGKLQSDVDERKHHGDPTQWDDRCAGAAELQCERDRRCDQCRDLERKRRQLQRRQLDRSSTAGPYTITATSSGQPQCPCLGAGDGERSGDHEAARKHSAVRGCHCNTRRDGELCQLVPVVSGREWPCRGDLFDLPDTERERHRRGELYGYGDQPCGCSGRRRPLRSASARRCLPTLPM